MRTKIIGYIVVAIVLALLIAFLVFYYFKFQDPPVFSIKNMLDSTWNNYKERYIEVSTGRVVDLGRENVTTSEGISYTMLRAVWIDDQPTFDRTFAWAQKYIQRKDKIFSWLYGKKSDGTFAVLTEQGGQNTASDADINIAMALIFAANRWSNPSYLIPAKEIINGIWEQEVITINNTPYLAANNVEKTYTKKVLINPSYLEPYAYRIFATIDIEHPWIDLVDSSYDILEKSTDRLPPDWVTIDRKTGNIIANDSGTLSTNYSYDALRVPWNIALDYEWFAEPRALQYLSKLNVLSENWNKDNKLFSVYSTKGDASVSTEIPAMYGGSIGYFTLIDPQLAQKIYRDKLVSNYNQDTNSWSTPLSYYDDNWAWFGIALYNHLLPNLTL